MKTFDDLQSIWNQQTETKSIPSRESIILKAEKQIKKVKQNHYWTIGIISLTTLVLIFYYWWISAYRINALNLGLTIMILMLVFRIVLELKSIQKFQKIPKNISLLEYSKQTQSFYRWRKKIHLVITPIIYIFYTIGFSCLLPVFKENFSYGFFMYCIISGYGFLLTFGYFLIKQIKKELNLLVFLQNVA
jgi:hypothetical protein